MRSPTNLLVLASSLFLMTETQAQVSSTQPAPSTTRAGAPLDASTFLPLQGLPSELNLTMEQRRLLEDWTMRLEAGQRAAFDRFQNARLTQGNANIPLLPGVQTQPALAGSIFNQTQFRPGNPIAFPTLSPGVFADPLFQQRMGMLPMQFPQSGIMTNSRLPIQQFGSSFPVNQPNDARTWQYRQGDLTNQYNLLQNRDQRNLGQQPNTNPARTGQPATTPARPRR